MGQEYKYSTPSKYSVKEIDELLDKVKNMENPSFTVGTVSVVSEDNKPDVIISGEFPNFTLDFILPYAQTDIPPEEPEEPSEPEEALMYYGRLTIGEVTGFLQYPEIDPALIPAGQTMIACQPTTLNKKSLGSATDTNMGDYLIVAIPSEYNYIATKFDGFGGKVPFDEDVSGANGIDITIKGLPYKLYGEMLLAPAEIFIYVEE